MGYLKISSLRKESFRQLDLSVGLDLVLACLKRVGSDQRVEGVPAKD